MADSNNVYASFCAGKYARSIDHRFYLPEKWTNDKKRCEKVRMPLEKAVFKTNPQLEVEIIKEITSWNVEYDFIR